MLYMLIAIPDAAVLPGHTQKSPTAFSANVLFKFTSGCFHDPIGWVFAQFGYEGRRPGIRGKDRQRMTGPRHRHIHDTPLFGVVEWPLLRRDQRQ